MTADPAVKLETPDIVRPEDGVSYKINGIEYVRVMHPLSFWVPPQLKNWFIKNSAGAVKKKKTETAAQGSAIHANAHNGTEDRLTALLKEVNAKKLQSEFIVWSKNGWAGQADLLVEIEGKRHLIDIKTGRFGQAFPQLGAYSLAANEMGMNVEGVGVISLPRDETKPATYWNYSGHMEGGQIQYCMIFDFWKRDQYNKPFGSYEKLKDWPFFEQYATFSYEWSPILKYGEEPSDGESE